MKTLNVLKIVTVLFLLVSCSDDDAESKVATGNILYFTTASTTSYTDPGTPVYSGFVRSNIVNGKFYSDTFIDPATETEETMQRYFYTGNRLSSFGSGYDEEQFFYDAAGKLNATDWYDDTMQTNYKRFSYESDNRVFVDKMSAKHDDAGAMVVSRSIVQFDAQDNIIKAGYDNNLDGLMDNENNFTYANNNMITADLYTDGSHSFSYSSVIDNFAHLTDNTFGKKVTRLRYADVYADGSLGVYVSHSQHLTVSEVNSANYEVLSNGMFHKSSKISNFPGGQVSSVVEFFFD